MSALARLRDRHARVRENAARASVGTHVLVAAAAYLVASALALGMGTLLPVSSAALDEARRVGVVSPTTLAGVSKAREVAIYVAFEAGSILGTLALVWSFWLVARPRGNEAPVAPAKGVASRSGAALDLGVTLLVLWLTFDVNRLGAWWVDRWTFLSEEGLLLSTVERMLAGGVPYRDEHVMYGPLAVYPLRWLMSVFGPQLLVARCYFYALDVAGLLAIYHALRVFLRHRGLAALGLGFFVVHFALYSPERGAVYRPAIQETVLRFTLSFAWLAVYSSRLRGRLRLVATGAALGGALAYSQELGLVAAIACAAFLLVEPLFAPAELRARARAAGLIAAGAALVLGPLLAAMAAEGALGPMLTVIVEKARLTTLGYANVPFPAPSAILPALAGRGTIAHVPPLTVLAAYWIPAALSVCGAALGVRLAVGRLDREDGIAFGLLVAGGLAFRSGMARSDATHLQAALVPTVILAGLFGRRALTAFAERRLALPASLLVLALGALSLACLRPSGEVARELLRSNVLAPGSKLRAAPGTRRIGLPRARGIRLPEPLASEVEGVVALVTSITRPGEPILAFPNDALYCFLADRPNATRFPTAHMAATTSDREAFVADLERTRAPVLLISNLSGRPDEIADEVAYPEVVAYLRDRYGPGYVVGSTYVRLRRGP